MCANNLYEEIIKNLPPNRPAGAGRSGLSPAEKLACPPRAGNRLKPGFARGEIFTPLNNWGLLLKAFYKIV